MVTTIRLHLYQKNNRGGGLWATPLFLSYNDMSESIKSCIFANRIQKNKAITYFFLYGKEKRSQYRPMGLWIA